MKAKIIAELLVAVLSATCVEALEICENSLGMKLVSVRAGQF